MKNYIISMLIVTMLVFAEDKIKVITLNVGGMKCQNCAIKIEEALKKIIGVSEAKVELKRKLVTITIAKSTSTSSLIQAINDVGYSASEGEVPKKSEMKKHNDPTSDNCERDCCDGDHHSKSQEVEKH